MFADVILQPVNVLGFNQQRDFQGASLTVAAQSDSSEMHQNTKKNETTWIFWV